MLTRRRLLAATAAMAAAGALGIVWRPHARAATSTLPSSAIEVTDGAFFPTAPGSTQGYYVRDVPGKSQFWTYYDSNGGHHLFGPPLTRVWDDGAAYYQLFAKVLMRQPKAGGPAGLAPLVDIIVGGTPIAPPLTNAQKLFFAGFPMYDAGGNAVDVKIVSFLRLTPGLDEGATRSSVRAIIGEDPAEIDRLWHRSGKHRQLFQNCGIDAGAKTTELAVVGQYFKDNFSGGAELPGRALQTEAFALEPGDQGISDDLPGSVKGIDKGFGTTGAAGLGFSAGHAFMNQTGLWWDREQFIWNLMTGGGLDPAQFPKIATDRNFRTNKEIVGLLQFTPAYAGGGLGEPQKFTPPKGLDKAWNDPGNTWGQFVNAIVASRTPAGGGSAASGLQIHAAAADVNPISRWIPWNEPDICLPKFPGYAWGGTRDQFAQLVAVAYEAILAANPKAKLIFPTLGLVEGVCNTPDDTHGLGAVISAGSAGSISAFFDHFVRWVKARPNQAAIAKLNHYFHCVSLALHDEPERVCEFVQHYRALLDREFPDDPAGKKCIMLVESTIEDYACDPADPTCSPKPGTAFGGKDRAHYIIQAFANALFAGADEVAMFNAASWWNDADARAGARTAVRFLSHITRGHPGRKKTPNICGPSAYNYRGIVRIDLPGPGFVATVFYNRDGRQRDLELTFTGSGGPIVGADPTGKEQTLPAGKSTVKLETSATCFTAYGTLFCFLGGGTRIYRYPDTMVLTTSALS